MLYLELGVVPIRYIIKERRLNFLWYILNEDEEAMISMVLKKQLETTVTGDWGDTCKKDLEELGIGLSMTEIKSMKEETFSKLVKRSIVKEALEYLNRIKQKHSKVRHIVHSKLEIQTYLEAGDHSVQEAKFLFTLRTRMLDVRTNYGDKYFLKLCPCCQETEDTQEHLLSCYILHDEGSVVDELPVYEDLFSEEIKKQIKITRILKKRFCLRNKKENHFQ